MLVSNGVLIKSTRVLWQGSPRDWPSNIPVGFNPGAYSELYKSQLWVNTVIDKRGKSGARLPFKVYEREADGRPEAADSAFGQFMRRPSRALDPFLLWLWTFNTKDIYGESAWIKVRDAGGRPVEVLPLHPCKLFDELDPDTGNVKWTIRLGERTIDVDRRDLVIFREFNPDNVHRGLSKLEPLRATLENEDGARRANSALWRNGGRPSSVLRHPGVFKNDAVQRRLAAQWSEVHGGVDNWAKALVLEEGMTVDFVPLNVEELQYIEARKLNREEVCAAYDMAPPVVHILDRATFSNITEQHRSMYRDTMGPILGSVESTIEFELRDGRFGKAGEPDFGEEFYGEFLLDEVLRGAFEARQDALQKADYLTIAEKRKIENRPFIPGTDHIFLNSASLPLGPDGQLMSPAPTAQPAVAELEPPAEQPALPPAPADDAAKQPARTITREDLRAVMGRLGRLKELGHVDAAALVAGIDNLAILEQLVCAQMNGEGLAGFKERLRAMVKE